MRQVARRPAAATIVARNYVAQARVLHASLAKHSPELHRVTLLVDGTEADRRTEGIGEVLLPSDLPMSQRELEHMMLIYSVMEFSTALKPALLRYLVVRSARPALYLDPDIQVLSSLAGIVEDAATHEIVITPHTLDPLPRDGLRHSEQTIMLAGMYNLGFIAVSPRALRFLDWWHERLLVDAVSDPGAGLFTDQRWIDWVPSLFPSTISQNPGDNVAYWNLHHRTIAQREGRWFANDQPIRFFHFSGFNPSTPWVISKHMADEPRPRASRPDDLQDLLDQYAELLLAADYDSMSAETYRWNSLPNGADLTAERRAILRRMVVTGHLHDAPLPFTECDAFIAWLSSADTRGHTRFARMVWSVRDDLQGAFPDLDRFSAEPFQSWTNGDAWFNRVVDGLLEPAPAVAAMPPRVATTFPPLRPFGWNIIAYADAELGVGEVGRRMARMVRATGVPARLVSVPRRILSRAEHQPSMTVNTELAYENSIICVNADMVSQVTSDLRLAGTRGRRIGVWFWELDELPPYITDALEHVHEVWVTNEITRAGLMRLTDKPVRLIRIPLDVPDEPTPYTREQLGLPVGPLLLTNLDYLSVPRRKNPLGVIAAYRDAVQPDEGVTLVVKSINAHRMPLRHDEILRAARGRPDIRVLDTYVTQAQMQAMIELSDVYISLHRGEGFGLNVADALARATPVICTGYSGTMEFTNPRTARLVRWKPVAVGPDAAPYPPTAIWAEPDHEDAVRAIRSILDNPAAARARAQEGVRHLREQWSLAATSAQIAPFILPAPLVSEETS